MEEANVLVDGIQQYGFPIVACVGFGYFLFYIWKFISNDIEPELAKMHFALIRVIDRIRMLDQDLIRLQQKVNVVLEYKENEKKKSESENEK